MANCFQSFILTLLLFNSILVGCNKPQSTSACPDSPTESLPEKNVKTIDLSDQLISESNQVSFGESVGYRFQGKAGKNLIRNIVSNEVCHWVYTPNNKILKGTTELPDDGLYLIQISAKQGSQSFKIDLGYDAPKHIASPTPSIAKFTPSPSPSPSPTPSYSPPSSSSLTQERALSLVKGWYKAKPRIFGSSFETALVSEYTTEKLYYETLEKEGGGSVGWLKRNGCYYDFNNPQILDIIKFSNSGSRPFIVVDVSEDLALQCNSSPQRSLKSYRKTFTYYFKKDRGEWKITEYSYPGKPE